jgi:hypothetical protein
MSRSGKDPEKQARWTESFTKFSTEYQKDLRAFGLIIIQLILRRNFNEKEYKLWSTWTVDIQKVTADIIEAKNNPTRSVSRRGDESITEKDDVSLASSVGSLTASRVSIDMPQTSLLLDYDLTETSI